MHYLEADDAYFEIVTGEMTGLFASTEATQYPETRRAFLGFCAKTNSLKTALFDMIESNNPYAFNALFRCLCEHYLKFLYIFVRFTSETSDLAASEYYSYCGAIEARDYLNSIAAAEALLGNEIVGNVQKAIATVYPEAAGLSTRQLEREAERFKYRSILRFLQGEVPGMVAAERPFLASIVPAYALLSSFVHGGPYTEMEIYSYAKPEALQKCEQYAEIAFLMAASVFMMSAAALSRENPMHSGVAPRVKKVIDRFTSGRP